MLTKHHKLLALLLTGLYAQVGLSATSNFVNIYSPFLPSPFSFVATLTGSVLWQKAGENQTLALTPDIVKAYKAGNEWRGLAGGEIFLGVQTGLPRSLQGQLGFAFAIANDAVITGDIWDDANPRFNNYTYRYEVNHLHYAVKGKLIGDWGCCLLPWISAAVGVGYNNAYNFTNTPSIREAVRNSNFSGNKESTFTYSVGAGFQYPINKCWQVGLGYEFSDWGKNKLGPARGQSQGEGLSLDHLYTHAFQANLTYIS